MAEPIFTEEQQSSGPPPMFSETPQLVAESNHSDDQVRTTASLAALATQRNNPSDTRPYGSLVEQYANTIYGGGEDDLRNTVGQDAKFAKVQDIQKKQLAIVNLPNSVDADGNPIPIKDTFYKELQNEHDAVNAVVDPLAIEKEGVAQAQEAGAHDQLQSDVLFHQHQEGFIDHIKDNVTKHTILHNILDKAQEEQKKEGLGSKILNMLSLPLNTAYALKSAVPGTSGILPGTVLNNAVDKLMTLPLGGKFEAAAANLYPNIKAASGVLLPNLDITVSVLDNITNFSSADAFSQNFWAGVDVASLPGVGKALRLVGKPAGLLRAVGNRAAAVDTHAADLAKDIAGMADTAGGTARVHNPSDMIEGAIPRVSTGSLLDNSVGIFGTIAKKIRNQTEAVQRVLKNIDPGVEYRANRVYDIDAAEKELALRLENDNVVDIHNAVQYVPANIKSHLGGVAGKGLDPLEAQALHDMAMKDLDGFTEKLLNIKESTGGPFVEPSDKVRATPPETTIIRKVDPSALFEYGTDNVTGGPTISVHVGDIQGYGGYSTLEDAILGAKARGWDPNMVEYVESSGQHFIRMTQKVPETGVMVPKMTTDLPASGRIAQFLKNSNDLINNFYAGSMVRQTHIKSGLAERVVKPLFKTMVSDLSSKSRKAVKAVIDLGQREVNPANQSGFGKWYTMTEFGQNFERVTGRAPLEKEIRSYYAYKDLNDIDYQLRNEVEWSAKNHRGTKTVSIKVPSRKFEIADTNGRDVSGRNLSELGPIYDSEEGRFFTGKKLDAVKEKMASGNYKLIELEANKTQIGKDPIKVILAHNDATKISPLRAHQVDYVEGGHRLYRNKWFVKQAVTGQFSSQAGGGKYFLTPITHSNHALEKDAVAYAERMEKARLAGNELLGDKANRTRSVAELKQILRDTPNIGTIEKYKQLVKSGALHPDTKFEAVIDGTQPSEMNTYQEGITRWYDPGMPSYEEELISRGGLYYGAKGERLTDDAGMLAPVLDPFKTLDQALGNVLQAKAFSVYNTNFVEEWTRLAEPWLDKTKLAANRSPQELFTHGVLDPSLLRNNTAGSAVYQTLEQMRDAHKRLLNYKTKDMMNRDFAIRRFANYMENHLGGVGDWVAGKAYHWSDRSPIAAFKGFVFDAEIGMFNLTRLWLHSQTAMAAITTHPAYGLQAGGMSAVMHLLQLNRSEALLDHVASWGKAITGFEKSDFKDMLRAYHRSGNNDVSGEQGMLDHYPMVQQAAKLRNAGRMPLYLAERYNRMTAWQIAWRVAKDESPDLAVTSDEFLSKVHIKADDLSMNQTSASKAMWQKGLLAVPTQFMQYQARLLEKMLPLKAGGNKRMSAAMRGRLLGGQLMMYGAAAVPGASAIAAYASHQYQDATGQPLNDDTWRKISKGMWDSLLFHTTGVDTDAAAKAGIGATYDDLWSEVSHGDLRSVLEFVGGPSLEIADQATDTFMNWMRYFKAEQVDKWDSNTWTLMGSDLAKHVAGLNNFQKAYWTWQYGILRDTKGMKVAPATDLDAIAQAFGMPLRVEREHGALVQTDIERKEYIRAMANKVTEFRLNAARAMESGNLKDQDYWNNMVSGWLSGENLLTHMLIVKEADDQMKNVGWSYQALVQRSEQLTGERPLGENH